MLNSKILARSLCVFSALCGIFAGHGSGQEQRPIGPVAAHPRPVKPDPKEHLQITATVTEGSVKVSSISHGDGPPRGYLSQQSSVVVLLKGKDGRVLSRTQLPDPLELRVMESNQKAIPPKGNARLPKARPERAEFREHVIHVASNQLRLYLPFLPDATLIEFHAKEDSGKLLGSAPIPQLR
jgi:hypothetical protein